MDIDIKDMGIHGNVQYAHRIPSLWQHTAIAFLYSPVQAVILHHSAIEEDMDEVAVCPGKNRGDEITIYRIVKVRKLCPYGTFSRLSSIHLIDHFEKVVVATGAEGLPAIRKEAKGNFWMGEGKTADNILDQ